MPKVRKLLIGLFFMPSLAFAVDLYQYKPGPNCAIQKNIANQWTPANDLEVIYGIFSINPSKDGTISFFHFNGGWYNSKSECFSKPKRVGPVVFLELRATENLLTGSGNEAQKAYSTDFGYGARYGVMLAPERALYLDVDHFSGGLSAAGGTQSEHIWSFDLGYQLYFVRSKTRNFIGVDAGLSLYSGTSTNAAIPLSVTSSAQALNIGLELGSLFKINDHFELLGSIRYTFLPLKSATVLTSSNQDLVAVGSTVTSAMSFDHLGINFGVHLSY